MRWLQNRDCEYGGTGGADTVIKPTASLAPGLPGVLVRIRVVHLVHNTPTVR